MSQFHPYRTAFDYERTTISQTPELAHCTQEQYYQTALALSLAAQKPTSTPLHPDLQACGSHHFQSYYYAEYLWLHSHQPTYKLYPDLFLALLHTSLDIPCPALHAPYPQFVIQLPVLDHPLCQEFPALLINHLDTSLPDHPRLIDVRSDKSHPVCGQLNIFWHPLGSGEYSFSLHPLCSDLTLQQSLKVRVAESGQTHPYLYDLYRIVISTMLFAIHQHELVLPEVPYPTIQRQGRGSRILQAQSDAAHAKKNYRWTVGKEIHLPRPLRESLSGAAEGNRHLSHSHLRSGHMRRQAHGPGYSQHKLIFIAPTLVRADLAPSTAQRTYGIHQ